MLQDDKFNKYSILNEIYYSLNEINDFSATKDEISVFGDKSVFEKSLKSYYNISYIKS